MRHFDLVQRLEQLPPSIESANPVMEAVKIASANGMGAVSPMDRDTDPVRRADLGFDYMGSSEFEFGAIPQSARRIVANISRLAVVTNTLVRPTYEEPVHFVCTDEQAETILPVWHEWSQNPRSLERPHYFRDADRDSIWEGDRTVAWWALNEDLLWTRDEGLAEKLKEGFTQRKRELFAQQSLPKRVLAKLTGDAPQ
jgi:hypothetical protein